MNYLKRKLIKISATDNGLVTTDMGTIVAQSILGEVETVKGLNKELVPLEYSTLSFVYAPKEGDGVYSFTKLFGTSAFKKRLHIVSTSGRLPEGEFYCVENNLEAALKYASELCYTQAIEFAEEYTAKVVAAHDHYIKHEIKMWIDLQDTERQPWIEAAAESLGDLLYCTRTWSAWSVGTMSEGDFKVAGNDQETIEELACKMYEALAKKGILK